MGLIRQDFIREDASVRENVRELEKPGVGDKSDPC